MQTPAIAQMAEVQAGHISLATVPCQWTHMGHFEACGAGITYKSDPAHFRDVHGIANLKKDAQITCLWEGCQKRIQRKNFFRHVRECHLGHCRT